jgi:methyl coenzyme M reductase alpha subunit
MSVPQISETEVDAIVIDLMRLHSPAVTVDVAVFHDLLKHSLSLNTMEKKRVVDAVPTLSQFQFDELAKVFTEEREKFRELAKDHPEDIKKLLAKQQSEWIQLGDLYRAELENKSHEEENKAKEEEIKKSLGL